MPPAVSDDESSVGDVPYSKGKGGAKGKGKAIEKEPPAEEDDAEDEDEYVVEKITNHRFESNGTLKLEVKWQGFPMSENTWEPEDNLTNCQDDLDKYYKLIGGKPVFKGKSTPASSKKRKLSESATSSPQPTKGRGRQKKSKAEDDTSLVETSTKKWEPPKGSWEDHVISIDTMEKDLDGNISAYVMWGDGHRSFHSSKVVNQKCPQKMLQFYEAHLQFNPSTPYDAAEPESANGTKADDELDDEEAGIKPVASALQAANS